MNISQFNSPQILSGSVSIVPGNTAMVTLNEMASRSRRWLRLNQMNVSLFVDSMKVGQEIQLGAGRPIGSLVNIRAHSSRFSLMREYMRVWLLGPRTHYDAEFLSNYTTILGSPISINTNALNVGPFESYRLQFAKPFYLPVGDTYSCQLSADASLSTYITTSVTAEVSVQAVVLSKDEQKKAEKQVAEEGNPIPFLSQFNPFEASFVAGLTATGYAKSSNLELANPFLSPLYIKRLNGRQKLSTLGSDLTSTSANTRIKIADSRRVVCDLTDFRNVFNTSTASWLIESVLDGKKSDQQQDYLTAELYTANISSYCPEISMVGYRMEQV